MTETVIGLVELLFGFVAVLLTLALGGWLFYTESGQHVLGWSMFIAMILGLLVSLYWAAVLGHGLGAWTIAAMRARHLWPG